MSADDRVARLEALLERVRSRAGGARVAAEEAPAQAVSAKAVPAVSRRTPSEPGPEIEMQVQETVLDLNEPFEDAPAPRTAAAEEEESPASSRRTIAATEFEPEERISEAAFGSAEPRPPLHTPPPESGRLPAAPADTALVPETIGGSLGTGEGAADIIADAQRFSPRTFLELLDSSMSL